MKGMPMFARELMTTPVITIRQDATVAEAARLMLDRDVSALPVLNDRDRVVGILTQSDFGLSPKFRPLVENVYSLLGSTSTPEHLERTACQVGNKLVRNVMRRNVISVRQDDSIEHVARLMMRWQIHRLPVIDDGKLAGIITRHDFLKLIAGRL
jgi:CBS domain-containing protein